jgi:hypothetical protein
MEGGGGISTEFWQREQPESGLFKEGIKRQAFVLVFVVDQPNVIYFPPVIIIHCLMFASAAAPQQKTIIKPVQKVSGLIM